MKEIIFTTHEVSFDDKNWLYIENGWKYSEPSTPTVTTYSDFWELYNLLEEKSIEGITHDDTIFRKRPQIRISAWDYTTTYTPKNFRSFSYRIREKVDKPSVDWLLNNLNLEEFSEYCSDRNIFIPIVKT